MAFQRMKTFFIAVISILFSVAAQFSLKTGMSSAGVRQSLALPFSMRTIFSVITNWNVLGGFLLYGLGAIVWLAVLSKWDVSKAYPLVGLGFALTMIIGFMTGEQVTLARVVGVCMICAGIVLVSHN
jgi:multidrug transporter EmrE-like cation transporter